MTMEDIQEVVLAALEAATTMVDPVEEAASYFGIGVNFFFISPYDMSHVCHEN